MKLWANPDSYFGAQYYDYYILLGKNRDSDDLTRANFDAALARLGGESVEGTDDNGGYVDGAHVVIAQLGHWACGWVELLLVYRHAPIATMRAARQIELDMEQYPVLDEDLYYQYQDQTAVSMWQCLNLCERVELCAKNKVSIFAARHKDYYPQDDNGRIWEYLTSN